jgi:hypothetical protein
MDKSDEAWVHLVSREESIKTIQEHLGWCPFAKLGIEERVRTMENRFTLLIGFMVGSGILGGVAGTLLSKLLGQ